MRLKAKTILLVLVFGAPALIMCILVINKAKQLPIVPPRVLIQMPPQRHPGKERMLATLKEESLDQSSVLLMGDREQYFFPFAGMSKFGEDVQQDLEQVLSDRRFVKVLQEIESLPKSEGKAKCELLFSRAFQSHTNGCRVAIDFALDPSATIPTNSESLYMLSGQMTLSAALFIAADTANLDLLEKQFAQLDQWRAEIEPLARVQDRHGKIAARPALGDSVITPDYRLQVNVLRLAALRSGNAEMLKQVDEACAGIQMTTDTIPIVAWNAETTVFELLPDSPLDTSKGVTTYTFYDWSDKMARDHSDYLDRNLVNTNDSPAADAENVFVKKLESIVFHGSTGT